jgi:hypothetical protein
VTVGFFHVDRDQSEHRSTRSLVRDGLIRSIKQVMPTVELVQFTDLQTLPFDGVDRVSRTPIGPIALSVLEAYASCVGDWLFVDTDVVIQRDVREVFQKPFDVAVATREGTLLEKEKDVKFMKRMPYNKGAVFSRNRGFWLDAVAVCKAYGQARKEWMGDQQAMNDVIETELYDVLVLPNTYNYPPKSKTDMAGKAILHFKGSRKAWMGAIS